MPIFRLFTMVLFCLLLASCIYITNNIDKNEQATTTVVRCDQFVPPELGHLPDVPEIPDSIINNKDKTDTILVNKIKELREYSKSVKHKYHDAYIKHLSTCK